MIEEKGRNTVTGEELVLLREIEIHSLFIHLKMSLRSCSACFLESTAVWAQPLFSGAFSVV